MIGRMILALVLGAAALTPLGAQDLNDELERMTKEAARKVAPAVVQIVTQGGIDMVVTSPKGPVFRKGLGPTTGLIVDADGYIISSAFNFINNPKTILVAVPGHSGSPLVAERVATDKSRLLTLLKINLKGLPVPGYVPKKEIVEGQWSIALGRTLESKHAQLPSVSLGIISATGRIWGKALQTDAKISPVNYGGPIVDITGRVQGILVPASPQGEDATAGFEWYDSGIGFAVPMEDVLAVLPRLKKGKDIQKGMLGIRLKSMDMYSVVPEIGEVVHESAAAKAGLKGGDIIVEIDGHPVERMAQVLHVLGTKYEGDKISLKYRRGDEVVAVPSLPLVGELTVRANSYLGILPMRDDPRLGVEIRYVFPQSPADKAGLKAGDRIIKYGTAKQVTAKADTGKVPAIKEKKDRKDGKDRDAKEAPDKEGAGKELVPFTGSVSGREQLMAWLNTQPPGTEIKLEVNAADGKTSTLTATLENFPGATAGQDTPALGKLPEEASHKKALVPLETNNPKVKPAKVEPNPNKPDTGLLDRTTPDGEHKFWLYVPDDYDANIAYGLVVWLHPPGKNKEADIASIADAWGDYCKEQHLVMVCPRSENEAGWTPSEADFVVSAVRDTFTHYTIDKQRVVAHGLGVGGQMAIYLGFSHRDLFGGVATTGAVVTHMKDNIPTLRLAFYLTGGELDPLIKSIADSKVQLQQHRFPVVYREIKGRGREYLEDLQIQELVRWIDSLDRL